MSRPGSHSGEEDRSWRLLELSERTVPQTHLITVAAPRGSREGASTAPPKALHAISSQYIFVDP